MEWGTKTTSAAGVELSTKTNPAAVVEWSGVHATHPMGVVEWSGALRSGMEQKSNGCFAACAKNNCFFLATALPKGGNLHPCVLLKEYTKIPEN